MILNVIVVATGPVRAWNEGSEAALYRQRPYCLSGARYSDTTKTQSLARLGLRFSSHRLSQSERDLSRPELIEPHKGDKRFVRRKKGKFTKSQDNVGRSLAADRRKKAKTVAKKGEGDRGDQKPRKAKKKTKSLLSRLFGA